MTDEIDEVRICADCGGTYILTAGDQQFFNRRGLHLPRRCIACRKLRRMTSEAAAGVPYQVEKR